jgi:hypothetical protein
MNEQKKKQSFNQSYSLFHLPHFHTCELASNEQFVLCPMVWYSIRFSTTCCHGVKWPLSEIVLLSTPLLLKTRNLQPSWCIVGPSSCCMEFHCSLYTMWIRLFLKAYINQKLHAILKWHKCVLKLTTNY